MIRYFILFSINIVLISDSFGQDVVIKKNNNGDPGIEIKNSGFNTFIGDSVGVWNTGTWNTCLGTYAGYSLTSGSDCTFVGVATGGSTTSGSSNTAIGNFAMWLNTTGHHNVAIGNETLEFNSTGASNCAIGNQSLTGNTSGGANTAIGSMALYQNNTGNSNTAAGASALHNNSTGIQNTAIGKDALRNNSQAGNGTAIGHQALFSNTSGAGNTAIGARSLYSNTTSNYNTAIGFFSSSNSVGAEGNVAIGYLSLYENISGLYNTCVGTNAGNEPSTNPDNMVALGNYAGHIMSNSNNVEIGNASNSWIGGQVEWSTYSDGRIKEDVQNNVPGLSFINKLRPVTYHFNIHRENEICHIPDTITWKGKYDIQKQLESGFIAQEVEQAAKECNYDFSGVNAPTGNAKLYSLQYASFVVPLTKAVQELSAENEQLKKEIIALKAEVTNPKMETIIADLENRISLLEEYNKNLKTEKP